MPTPHRLALPTHHTADTVPSRHEYTVTFMNCVVAVPSKRCVTVRLRVLVGNPLVVVGNILRGAVPVPAGKKEVLE